MYSGQHVHCMCRVLHLDQSKNNCCHYLSKGCSDVVVVSSVRILDELFEEESMQSDDGWMDG